MKNVSKNKYKIVFGEVIKFNDEHQIKTDNLSVIVENEREVTFINFDGNAKYGVMVSSEDLVDYQVYFAIGIIDKSKEKEATSTYSILTQAEWNILPLINTPKEVYLVDEDIILHPGSYVFIVRINGNEVIKTISVEVVES